LRFSFSRYKSKEFSSLQSKSFSPCMVWYLK
jgi:hypothetical protein